VAAPRVLRGHGADDSRPIKSVELFFDLVYVFAFTQLSHELLAHLTLRGALETLIMFLAVWWGWNETAWATNWIDPAHAAVRVLLVALMLLSLVTSAAIPRAFDGRGAIFACSYVGLQALRSAFVLVAHRREPMARHWAHLLTWTLIAGALWIAGAFVHEDARVGIWALAAVLDLGAPLHGFWLPRFGSKRLSEWRLAGEQFAERFELVVLIALGESILALGRTFDNIDLSASAVSAFALGFVTAAALWWIYFVGYAEAGARTVAAAEAPAVLGRVAYAYSHAILVAGVIVFAVGVERALTHPTGSTSAATGLAVLGGPAIYLAGVELFKLTLWRRVALPPLVAIGVLAALGLLTPAIDPLEVVGAATGVAVALTLYAAAPQRDTVSSPWPRRGSR